MSVAWLPLAMLFSLSTRCQNCVVFWVKSLALFVLLWSTGKFVSHMVGQTLDPYVLVVLTWCMGYVDWQAGQVSAGAGNSLWARPQYRPPHTLDMV